MDPLTSKVLSVLRAEKQTLLVALGDFPKAESFEHGVQVGMYRGVQLSLDLIDKVLEDFAEEEARR